MEFKVEGKTYKLSVLASTTTLSQATQITKIEVDEDTINKFIDEYDVRLYNDKVLHYARQVIAILSDCPMDVLNQIDKYELVVLFDTVRHLVKMLYYFNFETHKPVGVTEVYFKGKKYFMPESLIIDNNLIPMHRERSKTVIEASNLVTLLSKLKNDGFHIMKYLCATYLKEDLKEEYDEETINKRAELFEELPLSIALEVFFCTYIFFIHYLLNTANSSIPRRKKVIVKVMTTLLGFMLWLKRGWQGLLRMWKR